MYTSNNINITSISSDDIIEKDKEIDKYFCNKLEDKNSNNESFIYKYNFEFNNAIEYKKPIKYIISNNNLKQSLIIKKCNSNKRLRLLHNTNIITDSDNIDYINKDKIISFDFQNKFIEKITNVDNTSNINYSNKINKCIETKNKKPGKYTNKDIKPSNINNELSCRIDSNNINNNINNIYNKKKITNKHSCCLIV